MESWYIQHPQNEGLFWNKATDGWSVIGTSFEDVEITSYSPGPLTEIKDNEGKVVRVVEGVAIPSGLLTYWKLVKKERNE